jgi:hypothetical protein
LEIGLGENDGPEIELFCLFEEGEMVEEVDNCRQNLLIDVCFYLNKKWSTCALRAIPTRNQEMVARCFD